MLMIPLGGGQWPPELTRKHTLVSWLGQKISQKRTGSRFPDQQRAGWRFTFEVTSVHPQANKGDSGLQRVFVRKKASVYPETVTGGLCDVYVANKWTQLVCTPSAPKQICKNPSLSGLRMLSVLLFDVVASQINTTLRFSVCMIPKWSADVNREVFRWFGAGDIVCPFVCV